MAININGDGLIELGGTSTTQGRVRLAEDTDNGTNYVELTANASVASNRTVTFPDADINFVNGLGAAQGGTGANTLTAEAVVIGNGTSAVKFVDPGTSGNVLTSNGTAWASTALPSASDYVMQVFTTPGTWTKPAGLKAIKVTVVGGGGGSYGGSNGYGGGGGGSSIEYIDAPAIPGPQPYSVGSGGTAGPGPGGAGGTGGTSSFGGPTAFLSATGGGGGGSTPFSNINSGPGGAGSNGQMNFNGSNGFFSSMNVYNCGNANVIGRGVSILGVGEGSYLGAGNWLATAYNFANPVAPLGYGVGGLGYVNPGGAGIAGSGGVIIVEEFY